MEKILNTPRFDNYLIGHKHLFILLRILFIVSRKVVPINWIKPKPHIVIQFLQKETTVRLQLQLV